MVVEQAIIVRDARKRYGKAAPILDGLNLNVTKGSIYGFLGASGCGKTTLLSCVVGVRKLDSGTIWVLGGQPGTEKSGIPGPRVGYMPQEISLVGEFTAIGALYFFGRINGLDDHTIEEGYLYLKDLLQLPPKNRLVKNMSGGQQRRVSFAAALLHKPELLILDEPTVGLDPVLRDNIWNHLVKITRDDDVTVIITTHYIEEARQADKIGLMRCGKLLAESSPSDLLEQWQTDSLEQAFLNLSQLQAQNEERNGNQTSNIPVNDYYPMDTLYGKYSAQGHGQLRSSRAKRCQALLMKNALQFVRHPGGVLFSIVLPILQVMLFYNTVGLDPKNIWISIVNEEAGNCDYGRNQGNIFYDIKEHECNFQNLSCRFVAGINNSFLSKAYYDSYDDAMNHISDQKTVAIMHIRKNFSSSLQLRIEDLLSSTDETLLSSQIDITLQTPDRQISLYIQKELSKIFFTNYENIVSECGIPRKYANIPIHFETPIFGSKDENYVTFVGPTFILSTLFILATSICSGIIITDRNSGVWDRSLVQGVTTAEILITHLISQLLVIIIQVTAALCLAFLHFDVECKGSMAAVIWLALLEGICGMSYGFLISVVCTSHALVNYASVGSFYPLILLCGIIWPIEGMPKALRWFSLALPLTVPGISLRGVLQKGTSMDEPEVYTGFIVSIAWIFAFISLCLIQMRAKST